jgi:lysophospholipase L1-like esterase
MDHSTKLFASAVILLLFFLIAETYVIVTFQAQNAKDSAIRVACVGDSITAGTEYPVDLWQLLGPNYVVGNFGIGGATVALGTHSSWINETGFGVAMQFQPEIVVITLGTNDANSNYNETNGLFSEDYSLLITEFQALVSIPKIFLVLPPPIFENDANLSQSLFTQHVIPSIRQVAIQTGLQLIDAYTPLIDHPEYFADGVHPDVEGAHKIAEVVYAAMTLDNT